MKFSRPALKKAGAVIAVIAVLGGVDAGFASHAEANLSDRIRTETNLEVTPSTNIGGLAYLSSLVTGKWSSISVRLRDIDVPGFGLVSIEYGAANASVPRSAVLSGDFSEAPVKQYFTKVSLDAISLGRKLGFSDLVIQNLKDISPAGGWETEALLEATLPEWSAPAQVSVKLRIVGGDIVMTPMEVVAAPPSKTDTKVVHHPQLDEETAATIKDAFALRLTSAELPLGLTATRVFVSGGSITVEGEQIQCTVSPENFMPAERIGADAQLASTNCRVR